MDKELRRWIKILNKSHGYGGAFDHETQNDKAIVELRTAEEWRKSIAAQYKCFVGLPENNQSDPPDCYVEFKGRRLGVELVQLINAEHKRRATTGETPYAGILFEQMQWTKPRFETALKGIIQAKGSKYEKRKIQIDVLVIHTAETWLNSSDAFKWLQCSDISEHPAILNVFLRSV